MDVNYKFTLRTAVLKMPTQPRHGRPGGGELQGRYGRFVDDKHLLPPPGVVPRTLGCPACSIATLPTELRSLMSRGLQEQDDQPLCHYFSVLLCSLFHLTIF